MSQEKVQVTVWVTPDTKQQWEAEAESKYGEGKLSHLIRLAVTEKINDPEPSPDTETQVDGSEIAEMKRSLNRMEQQMDGLSSEVTSIRHATASPPANVSQITNDVYAVLPPYKPESTLWKNELKKQGVIDWDKEIVESHDETTLIREIQQNVRTEHRHDEDQDAAIVWSGTPSDIADYLTVDVTVDTVRAACEQLVDDTSRVRTTITENGNRVYWKDE